MLCTAAITQRSVTLLGKTAKAPEFKWLELLFTALGLVLVGELINCVKFKYSHCDQRSSGQTQM